MNPDTAVEDVHPDRQLLLHAAVWFIALVLMALLLFPVGRFLHLDNWSGRLLTTFDSSIFWSAVVTGFFAQAVDGAPGMADGITPITFLLAMCAGPATASVHIAGVFTIGVRRRSTAADFPADWYRKHTWNTTTGRVREGVSCRSCAAHRTLSPGDAREAACASAQPGRR